MTDKLTINEPSFTLQLTQTEFELIYALLGHVRLSTDGNKYQQAAYNLLCVAEDNGLLDFDNVDVEIKKHDMCYEDDFFIEVSEMF
jgi:hypothetical protein